MGCLWEKKCNRKDCNTFCMKSFKLNFLYDNALLSLNQRKHRVLYIDNDEKDLDAFNYLCSIENNIEQWIGEGNNLYLYSIKTGNGKTSWALRLLESYFNKIWVKTSLKPRALFINVPRFLLEIKESISKENAYIEHIKKHIYDVDVVVWDDLGTKGLTEFEMSNVLNIVNARLDCGKSNIYTSNLPPNELHTCVGDRLFSRVINMSKHIELVGSDKRGLV